MADDGSGTTKYAQYTYLGAGTVVKVAHPAVTNGLELTYGTGGSYGGLDRFGRIIDQKWQNTAATTTHDRYTYGYDKNSNRLYKENVGPSGKDEYYTYDNLDRLTSYDRGDLNVGKTAIDSKIRNEAWGLEALGDWRDYQIDANGDGDYGDGGDLDQDRTHNAVNEITDLSTTANDPAYDSAGNMSQDDEKKYEYDAWRRLVKIRKRSDDSLIATYSYDGKNRRIRKVIEGDPDVTLDLYYNESWQILEIRKDGDTDPLKQYVWDIRYIDAPVCRFRDSDTDGANIETLYYTNDANMNVTALVGTDGTVVERYMYDPYGKLTVLDADWSADADNKSDYDNQILFCGYRRDAESDNYECRNRYLTTKYGWMTRDREYYDSPNFYEYVGCNPIRHSDSAGAWWYKQEFLSRIKFRKNGVCGWMENWRKRSGHWYDPEGTVGWEYYNKFIPDPSACPPPSGNQWEDVPLDQRVIVQGGVFKICRRDINPDVTWSSVLNALGGQHTYIGYGDQASSSAWGVGWGPGMKGSIPNKESTFKPSSCISCSKSDRCVKYSDNETKKASDASDKEIKDCLEKHPASKDYNIGIRTYGCKQWAYEAAKACGLDCK